MCVSLRRVVRRRPQQRLVFERRGRRVEAVQAQGGPPGEPGALAGHQAHVAAQEGRRPHAEAAAAARTSAPAGRRSVLRALLCGRQWPRWLFAIAAGPFLAGLGVPERFRCPVRRRSKYQRFVVVFGRCSGVWNSVAATAAAAAAAPEETPASGQGARPQVRGLLLHGVVAPCSLRRKGRALVILSRGNVIGSWWLLGQATVEAFREQLQTRPLAGI